MYPDYNAMVNEFIRPAVSLLLFVFLILGWVTAFMLMKENTILRIKLGKEDERIKEDLKIWLLRKTAPFVFSLYTAKASLQEEIQPYLKRLVRKNGKILKLAFRLNILTSIISTVFGIVSSRTNWEVRK
jgi:hypothetical protein